MERPQVKENGKSGSAAVAGIVLNIAVLVMLMRACVSPFAFAVVFVGVGLTYSLTGPS